MKEAWEAYAKNRERWEKKNSYYYSYTSQIVSFLVPEGKQTFTVENPLEPFKGASDKYDYIVVSDKLGYFYDIQTFFHELEGYLEEDGRIVITQYCALWEPIMKIASFLRLRSPWSLQNWISMHDIKTFLALSGFETVKTGKKMLFPVPIPFLAAFLNGILANLWPFSHLGLIHYAVGRRIEQKAKTNASFSIIVPARNESGTIERIAQELPACGAFTELIFIEGNSTDDTLDEIKRVVESYKGPLKLSYAVQDGKGKGDAVRKGFAMAKGDILTIYDADMTVPPEDISKFYDAIVSRKGDFINGSRLVYPLEKQSMRLLNYFGNRFFGAAFSVILGQPLKDTLCGTKVIWRKDYEAIAANRKFFGDFDPFGDFDLLFGAAKLNLKIIDLPIRYQERTYGTTNISRWKHGVLLLRMTSFAARKLVFW
jgi:hypothetical protein